MQEDKKKTLANITLGNIYKFLNILQIAHLVKHIYLIAYFGLQVKKNSYVPKINQDIFRNYKDQQDDGEEVKINYEKSNSEDSHTHNKILPLKKEAKGKYMLVNDHAFLMQNIHTYEEGGTWNIGKASMEVGKEEGADDNPQVSEWDFISEGEHHPYPYFGVFLSMTLLTSIVVIIVKCSG